MRRKRSFLRNPPHSDRALLFSLAAAAAGPRISFLPFFLPSFPSLLPQPGGRKPTFTPHFDDDAVTRVDREKAENIRKVFEMAYLETLDSKKQ
jgi:hypothetical protein